MLTNNNIKMGLASIRNSKWRSFLTSLGIIIGVVAVVTIVSLGQGIKQQVTGQINHLGSDLITIRPGRVVNEDSQGNVTGVNLLPALGTGSLTEHDIEVVRRTDNVKKVAPFSLITGVAEAQGREFNNGILMASTEDMPAVLNQKIQYGSFFTAAEDNRNVVVIGKKVAEQLFQENVPLGMTLDIRGQDYIVRGVFDEFDPNPLTPGLDFNSAIVLPFSTAKSLNAGSQLFQILAKPADKSRTTETIAAVRHNLLAAHAGQADFTVLSQQENLAATGKVLNLMTELITAIAAISLVVGGIGIMNIMLVSVSERTQEIGVRKAVGATNRQILVQFLTEAMVLSVVGGLVGVILAILTNFGLRIFTNLQPVIGLPIIGIALGVSVIVGIVFGVTPALRAARKDPIEALRRL